MPGVAQGAGVARGAGARFHPDAVQALPWITVDAAGADLTALAAHKVGGPKGVGALVVRRGVGVEPLVHGGGQERGLRSGTYNVAGHLGLGGRAPAAPAPRGQLVARGRAPRDPPPDAPRPEISRPPRDRPHAV